jgi:hypothetical protein
MKILGIILGALLSFNVAASDIAFTWNKPVPEFTETPPPGATIDEYRVYCDVDDGLGTVVSVIYTAFGYDTERHVEFGVSSGSYTCMMRSYSAVLDKESPSSNIVIKSISSTALPGTPTNFDFTDPNAEPGGTGSNMPGKALGTINNNHNKHRGG